MVTKKEHIYYVGPTRKYKGIIPLFMELVDDENEKTIFVDAGVYDIFKEYKDAGVQSPADDVTASDYFSYNVFLPPNTKLVGIENVRLEFAPSAEEISYGESRTWSPLNIQGGVTLKILKCIVKTADIASTMTVTINISAQIISTSTSDAYMS